MNIYKAILFSIILYNTNGALAQTIFSNVAEELGVKFTHVVEQGKGHAFDTGAAWFDCDGDGDMDLYITQRNGSNKLYRNNIIGTGELTFTNIADGVAEDWDHLGSGVSVADYDNDGDLDLYLANADQDVLLQNNGEGQFTNVTRTAFPEFASFLPGRGGTPSWGDLNNDGWLDLYVSNHGIQGQNSVDYLFVNNGGDPVTFTNMTSIISVDGDGDDIYDNTGLSFVTAMTDYDNDGDLDLYVTNDCPWGNEDNKLWRNEGFPSFTEVSQTVGPFIGGSAAAGIDEIIPDCQNAMGIAVGDPNRDGIFDLFYTNWNNYTEAAVFIQNDGENFWTKTSEVGLEDILVPETEKVRITWGTVFIDYNLDMLQDIAAAAGTLHLAGNEFDIQPNLLYKNTGIVNDLPNYERISDDLSGIADINQGRTLIYSDYDMDGDPDLLLVNFNGEAMLYQNNNENENNWLIIDLEGAGPPLSNLNGIGAKISITTEDGITQHHEVRSGSSLGGGDDIGAYFGLLKNEVVDIRIQWPSGNVTMEEAVEINQRIKLNEVEPVTLNSGIDLKESAQISVFPNPIVEGATVLLDFRIDTEISATLMSSSGREIKVFYESKIKRRSHRFYMNTSFLNPGVYLLKIETQESHYIHKIVRQ
ncbi:MAG: VCBS repeat-containing protein [Reichenbachiella sp.]